MIGGSAHIAAASVLTNIILEICLVTCGIHLIIGNYALVRGNLIAVDQFTLCVSRWIVFLLRTFRQVLYMLLLCHWVLFDAEGRYFRLLVSRLVLYAFIFNVLYAVVILLLIFDFQVKVVSHHILMVRL